MSDRKTVPVWSGLSFTSLLGLLFIGLKLTGYIAWSWWLVTLPIWFPTLFLLCILFVVLIIKAANGELD